MTDLDSTATDYVPNDAARLCGCSVDTIRRYRRDGRFPNAYRSGDEPNSPWRIPLADLIGAGLFNPETVAPEPFASRPGSTETQIDRRQHSESSRLSDALEQIAWLRQQNQRQLEVIDRLMAPASTPLRLLPPADERATA